MTLHLSRFPTDKNVRILLIQSRYGHPKRSESTMAESSASTSVSGGKAAERKHLCKRLECNFIAISSLLQQPQNGKYPKDRTGAVPTPPLHKKLAQTICRRGETPWGVLVDQWKSLWRGMEVPGLNRRQSPGNFTFSFNLLSFGGGRLHTLGSAFKFLKLRPSSETHFSEAG